MTAVDYQLAANRHRPRDGRQLAAEVARLCASGLTARDVAAALRLDLAAVITIIAAPQSLPDALAPNYPANGIRPNLLPAEASGRDLSPDKPV